jgi:hypothetical protein
MTERTSGWSIDPKKYSTKTLAALYRLLDDSPDKSQRQEIQRELVARAEAQGFTTKEILRALVQGVGSRVERGRIAKEWSEALGLSEKEAKRLAD